MPVRGVLGPMLSRPLFLFAATFVLFAAIYAVGFNIAVRTDVRSAESRFDILREADRPKPAAAYGKRLLALKSKDGADSDALAPLKADVAQTFVAAGKYAEGASYYDAALSSPWAKGLQQMERAALEDHLARARLADRDVENGVEIYADFLRLAGDQAARAVGHGGDRLEDFYADAVANAAPHFADALRPMGNPEYFTGGKESKLIAAGHMADLGAFYAMRESELYAAAGLLATSYHLRKENLGGDHQDTVQSAMILGPVYRRLGRLKDAENLYLEAFHAQEKAKGSNSPDLSLYIKLLAGVYEEQGRATEAQALYVHMRDLFRDAFGEQRYSANRRRDRTLDVNRPVSQQFVLSAEYAPNDLVGAGGFSVPLSKNSDLDEMKLRLAADADRNADPREENLPARLAQLISLCRSDTGERLSLRSGYRGFKTQEALHARLAHKGTVVPAGMSEHQLGLAADIDVDGRLMRQSDKSFRCFEENAFRFGFILSYPPGNNYLPTKESFEPWHWRYVGVRTAQLYREAGPLNRPQEFLAALTCYEDRAAAGAFAIAGEPDVCLTGEAKVADAAAPAGLLSSEAAAAHAKLTNTGAQ